MNVGAGAAPLHELREQAPTNRSTHPVRPCELEPYYRDGSTVFYEADAREALRALPDESVDACVTSPPYWSLRDYGINPSIWGGLRDCMHDWRGIERHAERYTGKRKWQHIGEVARATGMKVRDLDSNAWGHPKQTDTAACACGAWYGALGLEPTPELYVEHLVAIFRAVRRLLRRDGTVWLNLGDCYHNGDKGGYQASRTTAEDSLQRSNLASDFIGAPNRQPHPLLKPKDLVGVPWRVAFALQADGWYLRSDIIWAKPNAMPESVRDRPTKAHEYLFLLAKSERYFYDANAIREPASPNTYARIAQASLMEQQGGPKSEMYQADLPGRGRRDRKPAEILKDIARKAGVNAKATMDEPGSRQNASFSAAIVAPVLRRNKRTVWTLPTVPYPDAHFATFPPDLVEPCILAGSRPSGTVLDPFAGSCTTAFVAQQLGRKSIMVDPNAVYLDMGVRRLSATSQQRAA